MSTNSYLKNTKYVSTIMDEEQKKPFNNYNRHVTGGTEYMVKEFLSRIEPELKNIRNYVNIVIPGQSIPADMISQPNAKMIIWLHNTLNQFDNDVLGFFRDKNTQEKIKFIITVSEYHKNKTIEQCGIDPSKVVVIENAIDKIAFNEEKFNAVDKVKIIHASSPDRGMNSLLSAISLIDDDFELNIFNSFNPDVDHITPKMKELLEKDQRVNFYGKTPRKTVLKYFSESHIHAYPSAWEETSCITQIEALSTGNFCLFSNIGSLEETSLGFGKMLEFSYFDFDKDAELYAQELSKLIKQIKSNSLDFNPVHQAEAVYNNFSWDAAKRRWLEFDEMLGNNE